MAESSLSVGYTELRQEIGDFLGYGRTIASWTAAQIALVEAVCVSGVRRVYYPMNVSAEVLGYEWSWLRPTSTLYLGASGTDGTVVGAAFDSATYIDWVAQGITTDDTVEITAVGDGDTTVAEYEILTVAVGAITLTEAPGDGTSLTFIIKRSPANYDLPDDFGRLVGELHYATDDNRGAVSVVSIADLLDMRSSGDRISAPSFAAIQYKSSDGSSGQRQEILFWPKPNASYTFSYNYEAYSGVLSDTYPYPLGGMQLAELYIESCLAVAEQRVNEEAGLHTQMYKVLLEDAVARDKKRGAQIFGQVGNREAAYGRVRHGDTGGTYPITYKGNLL